MTTALDYPHLTPDAAGTLRIGVTRYTAAHLAGEHWHYGWTAEELLRQHPDLSPAEVHSALAYFYDHREEMVARFREEAEAAQDERPAGGPTRAELLRRRAGAAGS